MKSDSDRSNCLKLLQWYCTLAPYNVKKLIFVLNLIENPVSSSKINLLRTVRDAFAGGAKLCDTWIKSVKFGYPNKCSWELF